MSKRWIMAAIGLCAAACAKGGGDKGIPPQKVADALHAVMEADRTVYAREVVQRLQDQEGVIRASEHFRDDRALPLPAQMFRMGAEAARRTETGFTYALLSPWPINKQNAPRTEVEQAGLRHAVERGQPTYATETLGSARYFTAIYPDKAVAEACVACHNEHRDSPKRDFKVGDTMGGVVIRIAVE
jgi:Protein of unknown function (DUF3365)